MKKARMLIFAIVSVIATLAMSVAAMASTTPGFTFPDIDISGAMTTVFEGVSSQVVSLLPLGIGIVLIMAVPRIISRVVRSFI